MHRSIKEMTSLRNSRKARLTKCHTNVTSTLPRDRSTQAHVFSQMYELTKEALRSLSYDSYENENKLSPLENYPRYDRKYSLPLSPGAGWRSQSPS